MKKIQALLCGYYGFGNGGDEALLATLLKMLPPYVSPLVLSGNPKFTTKLHGVQSCDREHPITVLRALATSQVFIWGGGSLISDATSVITPLYYGGLMSLAQMLGLKTIAWAQGIGPLNRHITKSIAQKTFQHCTAISVRDRASEGITLQWGVSALNAPDPVWGLKAKPFPAGKSLPSPRIAVVLREHPRLTPSRLQRLAQALNIFQAKTQAHILFIPFQINQDLEIAESMHAFCKATSQVIPLTDPQELKGIFQVVDMTIAMRLHGLIMAAAEGCRCFAISYDPKVQQLVEDIGCPSWDIDQIPNDKDEIVKAWLNCFFEGARLTPAQIHDRITRSLMHQRVLYNVLGSD